MKRAWMLLSLACVSTVIASGCTPGGFGPGWGYAQKGSSQHNVTSEPIQLDAPTSAPAEAAVSDPAGPPDEELDPLTRRIEDYFGQFPLGNPDRQADTDGISHSPPPAPPTMASAWTTVSSSSPDSPGPSSTGVTGPLPQPASASEPEADLAWPLTDGGPATHGSGDVIANTPTDMQPLAAIHTEAKPSPLPPAPKLPAATTERRGPRAELINVKPVLQPATTDHPQLSTSANQPAGESSTADRPNGIVDLIGELEQSAELHPEYLDDQLKLRLLYLATGQDDKATGPFEGVDPVQAELLSAICELMASVSRSIQERVAPSASALTAVDELRRLLGQQLTVTIPKMVLVTRVNSFGDYDAVIPPRFAAGRPVQVFLYAEVANFRSQPTADGKLRTMLSETVEIFDATGKIIWQRTEPGIEDRALTPRRDFFVPFPITLPAATPPGEYILKATIEDKLSATTDQQRMTFTIEAR